MGRSENKWELCLSSVVWRFVLLICFLNIALRMSWKSMHDNLQFNCSKQLIRLKKNVQLAPLAILFTSTGFFLFFFLMNMPARNYVEFNTFISTSIPALLHVKTNKRNRFEREGKSHVKGAVMSIMCLWSLKNLIHLNCFRISSVIWSQLIHIEKNVIKSARVSLVWSS